MTNHKIAYIHYPHNVSGSRLETMAFSLNSVISLANMGLHVDLYLWEEPSLNYKELLPDMVTINYFKHPNLSLNSRFNLLRPISLQFQFQHRKNNYISVFGLGQIGAFIGNIIARANQCSFIYLNDEFASCWGDDNPWTRLEQEAVKNASLVITPDLQRFHHLCTEMDISKKSFAVLPNTPIIQLPFEDVDWYAKLGIERDQISFLHAGSVADWAQIPEILSSIPYWPKKTVLIIHSHSREALEKYRQGLAHLELSGRVIWSHESLTVSQLNSLVSHCAGNFALYRNTDLNFQYIGFSSGKLMRSLACGSPVIASKLSSFGFVEDHQLGFLVNHPVEIPHAIKEIMDNRESYSQRCLEFCSTDASFEKAWLDFLPKFEAL